MFINLASTEGVYELQDSIAYCPENRSCLPHQLAEPHHYVTFVKSGEVFNAHVYNLNAPSNRPVVITNLLDQPDVAFVTISLLPTVTMTPSPSSAMNDPPPHINTSPNQLKPTDSPQATSCKGLPAGETNAVIISEILGVVTIVAVEVVLIFLRRKYHKKRAENGSEAHTALSAQPAKLVSSHHLPVQAVEEDKTKLHLHVPAHNDDPHKDPNSSTYSSFTPSRSPTTLQIVGEGQAELHSQVQANNEGRNSLACFSFTPSRNTTSPDPSLSNLSNSTLSIGNEVRLEGDDASTSSEDRPPPPQLYSGHNVNSSAMVIDELPQRVQCTCPVKISNELHDTFLDPFHIIECGSQGCTYLNTKHDILLRIPEEALPEGTVVNVGVALSGPFTCGFPNNNAQPISPIVWLCPYPKVDFMKPYELILPHCLELMSDQDCEKVRFMKTTQHDMIQFEPVLDGKTMFSPHRSHGILETTHCCYICITKDKLAEPNDPNDPIKTNFILIPTIPCSFALHHHPLSVYFCVTYCLASCVEVSVIVCQGSVKLVLISHMFFILDSQGAAQ